MNTTGAADAKVYQGVCGVWEGGTPRSGSGLRRWGYRQRRRGALASGPTLSRLETSATQEQAAALHGVLLDQFIASRKTAPEELVLDIDATHVPLQGAQERSHFHAYYDNYCYLPLYVFAGQDLLACVLRRPARGSGPMPSNSTMRMPASGGLMRTASGRSAPS